MAPADPLTDSEPQRQAEVDRLGVDRFADTAYDDLTRLAANICRTPIALISLIDRDLQWFKSKVGTELSETPREHAFCAHAIQRPDEPMVVEDASLDPRFANNPLVTGDAHIRFYAAAPLVTSAGQAVGTLCVIDHEPRKIDARQLDELRFLAQQVVTTMERRRAGLDAG